MTKRYVIDILIKEDDEIKSSFFKGANTYEEAQVIVKELSDIFFDTVDVPIERRYSPTNYGFSGRVGSLIYSVAIL